MQHAVLCSLERLRQGCNHAKMQGDASASPLTSCLDFLLSLTSVLAEDRFSMQCSDLCSLFVCAPLVVSNAPVTPAYHLRTARAQTRPRQVRMWKFGMSGPLKVVRCVRSAPSSTAPVPSARVEHSEQQCVRHFRLLFYRPRPTRLSSSQGDVVQTI